MKRKLLIIFSMVFVLAGVVLTLTSCNSVGDGANGYVSQEVAEKEFGQGGNREPAVNHIAKLIDKNDDDPKDDDNKTIKTGSITTEYKQD